MRCFNCVHYRVLRAEIAAAFVSASEASGLTPFEVTREISRYLRSTLAALTVSSLPDSIIVRLRIEEVDCLQDNACINCRS